MLTHRTNLALFGATFLLLTTIVSGQLVGRYTIDPNGTGSRNFLSLSAASQALTRQGVSGLVHLTIADGVYPGIWYLTAIPGTSPTNRVIFQAATPLGVKIQGGGVSRVCIKTMLLTLNDRLEWIEFDGITFLGKVSVSSAPVAAHVEIRNSVFRSGNKSAGISLQGKAHVVRHCRFLRVSGSGVATMRGADHAFHHNIVEDVDVFFTGDGLPGGGFRVYNNLFFGARETNLVINAADTILAHNTIVADVARDGVVRLPSSTTRPVRFFGNIIANLAPSRPGPLIVDQTTAGLGFLSDGNLYYQAVAGEPLFSRGQATYRDLGGWRSATGQDGKSRVGNPKFQAPGFQLTPKLSPAIDRAVGTPTYINDDLTGDPRDDGRPDAGCYERFQAFRTFGAGCPGSLGHTPVMGCAGTPALGSTNFAFTLQRAVGSAPVFFSIGASNRQWAGLRLPFRFGGRCDLLVSPDIVFVLRTLGSGPGDGSAKTLLPIPNDPTLRGRSIFVQWAVVDAFAIPGLAFSDGGHLTFR